MGYQSVAVRLVIGRSQYDLRLSLHKLCPWAPGFSTSSGRLGGSCLVFIFFLAHQVKRQPRAKPLDAPPKKNQMFADVPDVQKFKDSLGKCLVTIVYSEGYFLSQAVS